MSKRMLSFIIMLTLILSTGSNVLAAPSVKESNNLKETREQKKEIQQRVGKMDSEIDNVIDEIDKNKQLMNKIDKEIKDTESKLAEVKKNVKTKEDLFAKRVRAMYISGGDSYLNIILASKDLGDFMSRIDIVSKIMNFDKNVVTKLKAEKESIAKQKENLNEENNKLAELKKSNQEKLARLNTSIQEEKLALNKVTEKENQIVADEAEKARQAEENSRKAREVAVNNSNSSQGETLSRGGSISGSFSKTLTMVATAYAGDGITASGNPTVRNPNGYSTIAVDPRVIAPGSKVYVEGYGYAVADDTGGAIKGNRIDLFMHSEAECNSWGVRTVTVHIIG